MNYELIRILREQAQDYACKMSDESEYHATMDETRRWLYSKFAELIVQECIKTIQLKIPRSGNTPENLRSYQHVQDIRTHFGVE